MYCLVEATERFTKNTEIREAGTRFLQVLGFDGNSALLREADGREWRLVHPSLSGWVYYAIRLAAK